MDVFRLFRFSHVTVCVLVAASFAQQPTPDSAKTEVLWHEVRAVSPTMVVLPSGFDASKSYPLVVALHGYGSTSEAFSHIAPPLTRAGFIVALPESPYAILVDGQIGYDWTLHSQHDRALSKQVTSLTVADQIPAVIAQVREKYPIDRVYVLGFSQGSVLALLAGVFESAEIDAVVAFGLPTFRTSWFPGQTLAKGADVRVLLVHGTQDVIASAPISREARDALATAGYKVELRSFTGAHGVPSDEVGYAAEWLSKVPRRAADTLDKNDSTNH